MSAVQEVPPSCCALWPLHPTRDSSASDVQLAAFRSHPKDTYRCTTSRLFSCFAFTPSTATHGCANCQEVVAHASFRSLSSLPFEFPPPLPSPSSSIRSTLDSSTRSRAMAGGSFRPGWKRLPAIIATLALVWTSPVVADKVAGDYFVHSLPGQPEGPLLKMHAG